MEKIQLNIFEFSLIIYRCVFSVEATIELSTEIEAACAATPRITMNKENTRIVPLIIVAMQK